MEDTFTIVPGATAYRVTVQLLCDDTHFCTEDQKTALLEDSGLLAPTTNKQDLKMMTSDAWRTRTADAVAQAVSTFFSTRLAGSGPARSGN